MPAKQNRTVKQATSPVCDSVHSPILSPVHSPSRKPHLPMGIVERRIEQFSKSNFVKVQETEDEYELIPVPTVSTPPALATIKSDTPPTTPPLSYGSDAHFMRRDDGDECYKAREPSCEPAFLSTFIRDFKLQYQDEKVEEAAAPETFYNPLESVPPECPPFLSSRVANQYMSLLFWSLITLLMSGIILFAIFPLAYLSLLSIYYKSIPLCQDQSIFQFILRSLNLGGDCREESWLEAKAAAIFLWTFRTTFSAQMVK